MRAALPLVALMIAPLPLAQAQGRDRSQAPKPAAPAAEPMAVCDFHPGTEARGSDNAWRRKVTCRYQAGGAPIGTGYVSAAVEMREMDYVVLGKDGRKLGEIQLRNDRDTFPMHTFLWLSELADQANGEDLAGQAIRRALRAREIQLAQVRSIALIRFTTEIPVLLTEDTDGEKLVKTDQPICAGGRVLGRVCGGAYTYSYGEGPFLVWTAGRGANGRELEPSLPFRLYVCKGEDAIALGLQKDEKRRSDWWPYAARITLTGERFALEVKRTSRGAEARVPSGSDACAKLDEVFAPEADPKGMSQRARAELELGETGRIRSWENIRAFDGIRVQVEFDDEDWSSGQAKTVRRTVTGPIKGDLSEPTMLWLSEGYEYGIYVSKIRSIRMGDAKGRQLYPAARK